MTQDSCHTPKFQFWAVNIFSNKFAHILEFKRIFLVFGVFYSQFPRPNLFFFFFFFERFWKHFSELQNILFGLMVSKFSEILSQNFEVKFLFITFVLFSPFSCFFTKSLPFLFSSFVSQIPAFLSLDKPNCPCAREEKELAP